MEKRVKREFVLEGLNCAHCAAKIEENVNKISGVDTACMNFATKTLTIETASVSEFDMILSQTGSIIKKLEPDVIVREKVSAREKAEEEKKTLNAGGVHKKQLTILGIGALLYFPALFLKLPFWVEFVLYFSSYLLVGGEVLLRAGRNILRGQIFDENFLMGIATIGAFSIGEFPEGVAVMLFYQVGEFFQEVAVNRSRRSIASLMDIRPDFANLKVGDSERKITPEEVAIGDLILVKPGERIPLDGRVVEGRSMLDTSALTGESLPREVEAGSDVLSGSINKNGLLTVEVTREYGESTVAKILDLVQNASSKKAPTESFITKFARYYTPVVVLSAAALALIPPLVVPGATFAEWINRALVFLVVSCPCALVVSIPLGFFGGIGGASRKGILIKGSNYLEALNNVDTVVFDKTGTLTRGVFNVTRVEASEGLTEAEVLEYAAYAESYSSHPIALSIQRAYGREIDKSVLSEYDEISGFGIKTQVRGREVLAGNARLMEQNGIVAKVADETGTTVHLAVDGTYAGILVISDEVKEDSRKAIQALRDIGIQKLVMLTGDSRAVGEKIGRELGLDEVWAELLPDQKVEKLEQLDQQKPPRKKLVFVGDGINDAPVLARADIGVAMGGVGSDAAIEAADVVLMTDEPSMLVNAIKVAKHTRNIVWQNIFFAIGIKVIVLAMGAGGLATIWEAVFADVGVAVLAILNAMRVMRSK